MSPFEHSQVLILFGDTITKVIELSCFTPERTLTPPPSTVHSMAVLNQYKARKKKETMTKEIRNNKNQLAFTRALTSDSDCRSANKTTGTGDDESTYSNVLCRKEGRALEHFQRSKV
jgi:hypothetical protein